MFAGAARLFGTVFANSAALILLAASWFGVIWIKEGTNAVPRSRQGRELPRAPGHRSGSHLGCMADKRTSGLGMKDVRFREEVFDQFHCPGPGYCLPAGRNKTANTYVIEAEP